MREEYNAVDDVDCVAGIGELASSLDGAEMAAEVDKSRVEEDEFALTESRVQLLCGELPGQSIADGQASQCSVLLDTLRRCGCLEWVASVE